MSFTSSNLSVLAYANNFTLWHYVTTDDSVTTTDYFSDAAGILRVHDLIIANVDTNGSPATTFYVVTANDGASVTVTAYNIGS